MPILRGVSYVQEVNSKDSKENKNIPGSRIINKKLDILDNKMNNLYKSVYISRPDNMNNLNSIIDDLDTNIDRLQKSNIDITGMTELIRRVDADSSMPNTKKYMESVQELFEDQNLVNTLFMQDTVHKYIASQNAQYDLICRYLPRLLDALQIKRDLVLCSDNFSKNFINPKSVKSNKRDIEIFTANTKRIEKEYDFSRFISKTFMNASIYGEDFIYVVPYDTAFKRLLQRANYRASNPSIGQYSFFESYNNKSSGITKQCIVSEGYAVKDKEFLNLLNEAKEMGVNISEFDKSFQGCGVNLYFNNSGVINEIVSEKIVLTKKQYEIFKESMAHLHENTVPVNEKTLQQEYEKLKHDNDGLSATVNDGLITPDILDKNPEKIDKNFTGAVVERLKRENVVPVYLSNKCVGYYYLQFADDPSACGFCGGHHTQMPGVSNSASFGFKMSEDQQELAIRYISARISRGIDAKFINVNKDLKEEIYAVLRYNEQFDVTRSNNIGVTFIPAEDIVHCYNELDENTHRGISDLQRAVVPAMLYILLYLTDIIGKITRSTDKRVYYVKQNVETNVARTMMNVVAQIKKGNMGMRQLESMNNILNIVGKYNDYIIPMGPSGDPPIQFDILQGQDINTPTDLMEKMEESAINTIMPFELVNSTYNQDFATSYTMSNSRLLRDIYTRQANAQKWISPLYTKVYNYEFDEAYSLIEVILPPPVYLVMNSNQQLFDNISAMADKIIDNDLHDEEDEIKTEFKRLYLRNYLGTYIDYDNIERLLSTAKVNVETKKIPETEDGANSDTYSGDEEF